jgi:3',5'-cyclic AMP phosphodiesterase CpdA
VTRSPLALLPLFLAACASPALQPTPDAVVPGARPVFLLLGDTQRTMTLEIWRPRHDEERLALVRAAAGEQPAFVLHLGDVVCHGARAVEWARFCDEFAPLFERGVPIYPALGNHDYYGSNAAALAHRAAVFPHVAGRRWFDLRFHGVQAIVLDSNFDELSATEIREQEAWLDRTLAAAERDPAIRHVLVACHHPPYTAAIGLAPSLEVEERFVARLTPKVRVFAAGHVHNYERFEKGGVQFLVSGGGGGPRREIKGAGTLDPVQHYCRFTVDDWRLVCDVIMLQKDATWRRVDGFVCP